MEKKKKSMSIGEPPKQVPNPESWDIYYQPTWGGDRKQGSGK